MKRILFVLSMLFLAICFATLTNAQTLPTVSTCKTNTKECLNKKIVARKGRINVYKNRIEIENKYITQYETAITALENPILNIEEHMVLSSWGLPHKSNYPEPGAFRLTCLPSHEGVFDPIVYPKQVKAGHQHQFYGNVGINGNSTYETLRAETRPSTCGGFLNQSGYWIPTLRDDLNAIRPEYITLYYKQYLPTDKECQLPIAEKCVAIPTGLRVISGFNMKTMTPDTNKHNFYCVRNNEVAGAKNNILKPILDICNQKDDLLFASIQFPDCWDGKNISMLDNRSHLAWRVGSGHNAACPPSHPVAIPQLTQIVAWSIFDANIPALHFSSDRMDGHNMEPGSTFHADYMEGWEESVKNTWQQNCIEKRLSCSGGELGDGKILKYGMFRKNTLPRKTQIEN